MLRFYTLDGTYLGPKKFHLAIHLTMQVLLYLFNVQLHTPLILIPFPPSMKQSGNANV